jgi:hypothetical protein
VIRDSAGAIQAMTLGAACTLVAVPGKIGMCATWQMGQVASEPGVSVCQNDAPIARGKIATNAIPSVASKRSRPRPLAFPNIPS